MPRIGQGPRLQLYGPDDKYGARPKARFQEYRWYIVWSEHGRTRDRATGLDHRATPDQREAALADFLASQQRGRRPDGPRRPDQISIAEILDLYGSLHAPHAAAPDRIGYAIKALLPWWGESPLSSVTKATCQRYARDRRAAIVADRAQRRRHVEARYQAAGKQPPTPKASKPGSDGTARRELGTLAAAINWCHAEGYITAAPIVHLPDKPDASLRWLSRAEAAALLRAARNLDRSSGYLPLFILLGLYTGARKEAILGLQWQPNIGGGWIDLDNRLIDYRKAAQAQTDKRRTAIPIPPRLMRFLIAARARTNQYVLEYRKPTTAEIERGIQSVPVSDPKKGFTAAAAAAGLPDITPHTLRHTAVTWLVRAGIPLWTVSGWVGMSEEMIRRVYGHHSPDQFRNVLAALR